MFLKVSSFLILGCFLAFSQARVPPSRGNSLTAGVGKSFKDFTFEIEKSFKELTKHTEWVYHLVHIFKTGLEEGIETITTWPVDLMLRVELFSMADGSHFVFPLSSSFEKEKHYKTVSIAVSNLTMSLHTMERVDKVLRNATKVVITKVHEQSDYYKTHHEKSVEKFLGYLLHEYFKIVVEKIEGDEILHGVYRKRFAEARKIVEENPKMEKPLDEIWTEGGIGETKYGDIEQVKYFLRSKETFHRAIVSKVFMKQSVHYFSMTFRPEQHKRYLLARSMIQLAVDSTDYESKVNDLYQQVLVKTGDVVEKGDFSTIREQLFNNLLEALELDPVLFKQLKVVMEEIKKTSVYDGDMYIDFSIL